MTRTYTFTECYQLLSVDPKTFRRWLEKAELMPTVSRSDNRIKYLTEKQVRELAELHDRTLQLMEPHDSVTYGAYKLLADRVGELEHEVAHLKQIVDTLQQQVSILLEEQQRSQEVIPPEQTSSSQAIPPQEDALPPGTFGWHTFANMHRIPQNEVRARIRSGSIHIIRGNWKVHNGRVKEALDLTGQHEFWVQFHTFDTFTTCDQCPHEKRRDTYGREENN